MLATARATLAVGGFVPFTTVDYPGKLSAVVFCQGCPWRCGYCHNAHLQAFTTGVFPWVDIHSRLVERQGFLDAIVFSGGEPTAQAALPGAMAEVKELGFLVGLHTAGIYPGRLAAVLPLADWVGFDVKAPFDGKYDALTQRDGAWLPVRESLRLLLASKVDYQIRTTLDRTLLDDSACSEVQRQLQALGAKPTQWQTCRPPAAVPQNPA